MANENTTKLDRREFILPTALNVLNVAHENIVSNLRRRRDSDIEFTSLFRLAFMVHHNTGEIMVTRGVSEEV